MCGECLQRMDHTGFAPAHGVCAFPVYTIQAPGCSAGVKPWSPALQEDSLPYEPPENTDPDVHRCKNPQKNINKPN